MNKYKYWKVSCYLIGEALDIIGVPKDEHIRYLEEYDIRKDLGINENFIFVEYVPDWGWQWDDVEHPEEFDDEEYEYQGVVDMKIVERKKKINEINKCQN
jgi:hypothetical protein